MSFLDAAARANNQLTPIPKTKQAELKDFELKEAIGSFDSFKFGANPSYAVARCRFQ
jgi:hypothetical protein